MSKPVSVKRDETNPEPVEIIARSIIEIADAMKRINASRLNRKAVVILIQAATGHSKSTIVDVLDCLTTLEKLYLKP
jgi:hypothetical protein